VQQASDSLRATQQARLSRPVQAETTAVPPGVYGFPSWRVNRLALKPF
jgi:hypothetical protein